MNDQDLRVVRSINSIKTTFLQMLKEKNGSVKKIKVTELAKRANINKGTFYLHYTDIYALYNEVRDDFTREIIDSTDYFPLLLSDPEEFLKRFHHMIIENIKQINFLWPGNDMGLFRLNLIDHAVQKMYETCPIEQSTKYEIIMDVITCSLIRISLTQQEREPQSTLEMEPETTKDILLEIIHTFFRDAG